LHSICELLPDAPTALLLQPSTWQRRPPPHATQNCVAPTALLLQPGVLQRRPPPWRMHRLVAPSADRVQLG